LFLAKLEIFDRRIPMAVIKCPNCGELGQTIGELCKACDNPVTISEFKTLAAMPMPQVNKYITSYKEQLSENPNDHLLNGSLAMCFLKLKLYDKALPCFEKAIEENFADSTPYFYAAVCLLKGKKAFVAMRPEIDKIEEYLQAAMTIEPKPIYCYFQAYIKYDYYSRKFFKTSPAWQEALAAAQEAGVSDLDIELLYQILGVERPNCL
jgi:tetratricopeptide (TPR) repeat protein